MAEGAGRAHALPSGTVCFLFTDVESSTAWLKSLGATRWAHVQARVQTIVRNAVESNGGVVVNTEGDGSFIAFGDAASAVCAARDAQREIATATWDGAQPRVRMGMHVGFDVVPRHDDYVALAVHQAARVAAAANGAQVLATEQVAAEAHGTELTDLGLFTVRDFDGPVRLYELALGERTPPPRAPSAFDTQVPQYRHALVGREAEIAEVVDRLATRSFVSLVGPAGVGKTRLAVAVLSQLSADLAAGPWFVDLTQAHEGAAVGDVIAAAVGCPPGREIGVHLDALLDDRAGLIVLDHCDHLADASSSVAMLLLDWCPTLQLIATSTKPIGGAGESEISVGTLPAPASADAGDVLDSAAGRLFAERATLVHGDFDVAENATDVERLCRAVDAVPLALELVAAMYEPGAVENVLARIGDGSLAAVIDAAIDGLGDADAAALAALSVAESPISPAMASAALASVGVGADDVAGVLDRLTSSALLRLDVDGQHSFLETVRARVTSRGDSLRTTVAQALLDKCIAILGTDGPLSRFEPVAATAAILLRDDALPATGRQRLAVQLEPWWIARLGRERARHLLLSALALDPAGPGAAEVHLAVADTYETGSETVDTEWHVQRAAILLGEHDAVDPAMIERLKDTTARANDAEAD